MTYEIKIVEEKTKCIKVAKKDFVEQGVWMHGNIKVSKMWCHKPTGEMFYENNEEVKARNLNVYPF